MSESVLFRRWLAALGLVLWTVGSASADPHTEIGAMMTALSARGQFNGATLVAQDGKIIYRNAFGRANFQTGADFTPETPSNIGSVTKQFTAMAIMILADRNKLQYDDPARFIGHALASSCNSRSLAKLLRPPSVSVRRCSSLVRM